MKQINKNYSVEDILKDTKHNSKAKEVFLKLLAKQEAIVILGAMNILYCYPSEDLLKTLEFL